MKTFTENTALVVIDVQEGFNDPFWGTRNNPRMESNIARLLQEWRRTKRPIYHVQHLSTSPLSPLRPGQPGCAFMTCAEPLSGETVVQKSVNSCFIGTNMERQLREMGQDTVIFAGLTTDHCVSTSTRMAANLGFRCHLVSDATATFSRTGLDGITLAADLVHAVSLASLNGEFADVLETEDVLSKS